MATAAPKTAAPAAPSALVQSRVARITAKTLRSLPVGKESAVKIAGLIRQIKLRPDPTDSSQVYPAFFGDFRALVGGKVLVSDELSLPQVPEVALKAAHEKNGEDATTAFSYSIYKEADTTTPRGFKWAFAENKPTAALTVENDPVMKLLA